jgi:ADP-heptose:LPS heptosyltransferase
LNIVINRTDAIGDTILTLPMGKFLKDKYPGSKIAFIVSPVCKDLFINHPYVDECWVLDKNQSLYKKNKFLSEKFKSFNADTFFHVGGSHLPGMVSWKLGIPFRGGLKSKWQSFVFLNKAVRQSRSLVSMHESDYNLNLLSPLGTIYKSSERKSFSPMIYVSNAEKEEAKISFKEVKEKDAPEGGSEILVIHPGMTGHTLNWASRNYARLLKRIESEMPNRFTYVISFTPSDEKFLTGLREQLVRDDYAFLKKKILFFDGSVKGLRHYISFLSTVDLFIGPSTGTTHIANTLGLKMIGLYSPIKVQSASRWGPFNRDERTKVVVPDVVCGEQFECAGKTCPYFECMAKIEVEDVFNAIFELTELKD